MSIKDATNHYQEQKIYWEKSPEAQKYAAAYKKEQVEQAKANAHEAVKREARQLDSLYGRIQKARTKVKEAQKTGPNIDYERLNFVTRRVEGLLSDFRQIEHFEAWYRSADPYEQMAAQSLRGQIKQRFTGQAHTGSVVKQLDSDHQTAQQTPELVQAKAELEQVDNEFRNLWGEANRAALEVFGEKSDFFGQSGDIVKYLSQWNEDETGAIFHVNEKEIEAPNSKQTPEYTGTKLNFA